MTDEQVITAENMLEYFKELNNKKKLGICEPYISSMVKYSEKPKYEKKPKLILDKILTLAIKNQEYTLLNELTTQVPTLPEYMHSKGFIDDNDYYAIPMGGDTDVFLSQN